MGISGVTYTQVRVVGQMASLAIVIFDGYEKKQELKRWLGTHGEEMKTQRGVWFGENLDKEENDSGEGSRKG